MDIEKLNTSEIEALIRQLALRRATLAPTVPNKPKDADMEVLIEDLPSMTIGRRGGGGFRLMARNRGIGWMAFQIDARTAAGIAAFITLYEPALTAEATQFVGNNDAHRH